MRLREERRRLRLTLRSCAAALRESDPDCGIDFVTLSQFENGRTPWPAARRVLAKFFAVPEAVLFDLEAINE